MPMKEVMHKTHDNYTQFVPGNCWPTLLHFR